MTGVAAADILRRQIAERLRTAISLRQIARDLGVSPYVVRRHAGPLISDMRRAGTIGQCACGKERFHQRGCKAIAKLARRPASPPEVVARRAAILADMMSGETLRAIASRYGVHHTAISQKRRFLTEEQRAQRVAAHAARKARRKTSQRSWGPPIRPERDPLYCRVSAALPTWLHPQLRDDVTSEMILAILEGTIAEADIRAHAKRFANAATAEYRSKWAPISLESAMFDGAGETLADSIPDPSALAAFDRIFEVQP